MAFVIPLFGRRYSLVPINRIARGHTCILGFHCSLPFLWRRPSYSEINPSFSTSLHLENGFRINYAAESKLWWFQRKIDWYRQFRHLTRNCVPNNIMNSWRVIEPAISNSESGRSYWGHTYYKSWMCPRILLCAGPVYRSPGVNSPISFWKL